MEVLKIAFHVYTKTIIISIFVCTDSEIIMYLKIYALNNPDYKTHTAKQIIEVIKDQVEVSNLSCKMKLIEYFILRCCSKDLLLCYYYIIIILL